MSRQTLYWLLQVFGWSFVFLLNTGLTSLGAGPLPGTALFTYGLCSVSGLVLTHGWRLYLRRQHYLDMPLARSVRWYVLWVLIVGLAQTLAAAVSFRIYLVPNIFSRVDWIPSVLLIWTMFIAIWTGLYVTACTMRRATDLEKQKLQTELLVKEARLETLRMQLNPHFLFNSLNSLRALIFEDAHKASEMVDRMAALLRYSLQQSGSNEMVTLADELQMVNEYLNIEKVRFEERLQVDLHIAEDSKSLLLPRMLLQTLVENAVKHGIERAVGGGAVAIHAGTNDGTLQIRVLNPGSLAAKSESTRLGLKNAEQRLSLLVGRGASLGIRQLGTQVEATILVPQ